MLGTGVTVDTNATLVCGHRIEKWAMIAAGAVVTTDVLNHALVAGVPAKQIGRVCECGKQLDKNLKCSCGREYHKIDRGLDEIRSSASPNGLPKTERNVWIHCEVIIQKNNEIYI